MLIFDFDGVLINSIKEACLSGYNTMHGTELTTLSEMPENLTELFIKNCLHFHNPYTLCSLVKWCSENNISNPDKILAREEFKNYQNTLDMDPKVVTPYFYETRRKFMNSSPTAWAKLNEPFSPIWEEMQKRDPKDIIILTAKNGDAVFKLCLFYGLQVKEENIYSGDNNKTKIDNAISIMERFNIKKFSFIDDHLKNLKDIDNAFNKEEKNIELILCNWGYGDKEDYLSAEKSGYKVLSQDQVIQTYLA